MRRVLYILGQLTDQDADWLVGAGSRRHLRAGDLLVRHGSRLDELYIVLDGELLVLSPGGLEIARVGVGDMLGEMSFVDDSPASASVRALGKVLVLAVPRSRIAADAVPAANLDVALGQPHRARQRLHCCQNGRGSTTPVTGVTSTQRSIWMPPPFWTWVPMA